MANIIKLLLYLAAIMVVTPASAQPAEPVLRFPNAFAFYSANVACLREFFECDNTSKTCLRGRGGRGGGWSFAGVVLADDRTTVLAHIYCSPGWDSCINFDTGEMFLNGGQPYPPGSLQADMPASAVDPVVERAKSLCPH